MSDGPSTLSLFTGGLYLIVAACCVTAAASREMVAWHRQGWISLVCLFTLLALMRWLDIEQIVQDQLRRILKSEGAYGARRDWQAMVVTIIASVGAFGAFWGILKMSQYRISRLDGCVLTSITAGSAMIALVAIRLISLHFLDWFLYGPLKGNWFVDLGLSLTVLVGAACYIRLARI